MLFLPFLDSQWQVPKYKAYAYQWIIWLVLIGSVSLILVANPDKLNFILYTILLVSLPEEWFFRAYFIQRVESFGFNRMSANIATSALFSIMHIPTQGWFGLNVFIPSLVLGWLYQQRQDIIMVILLHALSNLVYLLYLKEMFLN